jgi:hypothetical protein
MSKTIMEMSAETKLLAEMLRGVAEGEVCTYADMSAMIERDVRAGARGALNSARRILLRDDRIVFDVVIGTGVKRMTPAEIANSEKGVNRIRGATIKELKVQAVAAAGELCNEDRTKLNTRLSVLGAIHHCTDSRKIAKLQKHISSSGAGELAIGQTLEAMKG